MILLPQPSLFVVKKSRTPPASTWGQALGLWIISNLVGSGIYLWGGLFLSGGRIAATLRDSEAQYIAALLLVLAGSASLPTSLLAKFAYSYTLRRPRRLHRLLATLAALLVLYSLGAGLAYWASAGPQVLNPLLLRTAPGMLLPLAPYLLGGMLGTLIIYRRALFAPSSLA